MTRVRKYAAVLLLVLLPVSTAFATSAWLKTFNGLYSPGTGSAIKRAKCAVCHVRPNGKGGCNAYGKLLDGKDISAASLKLVGSLDADGDGVSNKAEIKAGTLPADPTSKP